MTDGLARAAFAYPQYLSVAQRRALEEIVRMTVQFSRPLPGHFQDLTVT